MALTAEQEKLLDEHAASGLSVTDYLKDAGMSLAQGVRTGLESIPAVGGDVYNMLGSADILLRKWAGSDPEKLRELRDYYDQNRWLPDSGEASKAVENATGIPAYQPKTGLGQGIHDLTSIFSGGGGRYISRDIIAPYVGGKIGEIVGEKLGGQEGAEVGSALGGSVGGTVQEGVKRGAFRAITGRPDPARQERFRELAQAGIPVTAGQATGSKALQYMETGPFEGKSRNIAQEQGQQYTRAVAEAGGVGDRIGQTADPDTMLAAQQAFGQEYENLVRANNGLRMDQTLQDTLVDIGSRYERLKGGANDAVGQYFTRIIDAAAQNGGRIPPDIFQAIHSEIAADRRAAVGAPELSTLSTALGDMQDALYDSIGRTSPDAAVQTRDLNNRYRNFKIIEKSVGGAGEDTSFGSVSAGKLRAELERRDPAAYAQGRGDLTRLARAGQSLQPLPNSGTAGRAAPLAMGAALLTALQQAGAGNYKGAAITGASTAAAFATPSILTSGPVRRPLVRRATGQQPGRVSDYNILRDMRADEPLTLAPILSQANRVETTPPVPVEMLPPEEEEQPVPVDEGMLDPKLVDPRDILRRRGLNYG